MTYGLKRLVMEAEKNIIQHGAFGAVSGTSRHWDNTGFLADYRSRRLSHIQSGKAI